MGIDMNSSLMLLMISILLSPLAGASDLDFWEARDILDAVAAGEENLELYTYLDKDITISDEIRKTVKSEIIATGARDLDVGSSSRLVIFKDGHVYTTGYDISKSWDLPEGLAVAISQEFEARVPLADPSSPIIDDKLILLVLDEGRIDDLDLELSILDLDDMDLELDGYDSIFDLFLEDLLLGDDLTELANPRLGIEYETSRHSPYRDSYNGVTCTWGTEEKVKQVI